VPRGSSEDIDREPDTVTVGGRTLARIAVGEEVPPVESPCPGCGAYYFALHAVGCEFEACPLCRGPLASCGCR
jgi:hypothetical protein